MLGGRVLPAAFCLLIGLARIQEFGLFVALRPDTTGWLETAGFYAACIHKLSAIVFMAMVITCFVIRAMPIRSARNPVQIAVALLGSFMMTAVAMAPQSATSPLLTIGAAVVMVVGSVFTAIALLFLGRSFSITPEARKLVTGGLYSIVRHPMYLGEMLGSLGMLMQALAPWTVLVFAAFCLMQVKRMDYEESVLQRVFPDYALYKRRTARLLPGLY